MNEQEQDSSFQQIVESLGSRLRSARDGANLELDEVASRLMLDKSIVMGLESGDYSRLPETAFIRGYLSAYLRLLKQPESLLDEFDEVSQQPEPLDLRASITGPACSQDGWARCVSVGLVVLLLVVVGLWVAEQSLNLFDQDIRLTLSEPEPESMEGPAMVSVSPSEQAAQIRDADKVVLQPENSAQILEAVDSAEEAIIETDNVQSVATTEAAEIVEQVLVDEGSSPIVSADGLQLSFNGESWVRVEDADGERLEAGTFREGESFIVSGKPPYFIILGRSSFVTIHYNGELVDLPADSGSVVRMTIGEAQSQQEISESPTSELSAGQ